jgi:hypothetical protein
MIAKVRRRGTMETSQRPFWRPVKRRRHVASKGGRRHVAMGTAAAMHMVQGRWWTTHGRSSPPSSRSASAAQAASSTTSSSMGMVIESINQEMRGLTRVSDLDHRVWLRVLRFAGLAKIKILTNRALVANALDWTQTTLVTSHMTVLHRICRLRKRSFTTCFCC